MGYLRGESRDQISLLPESLDDYVTANAVVRFIDRFVETLDLKELGFKRTQLATTGRPPYSPDCLLRLYIYGYLHQHRSSRQLARQTRCNVELMWLLEKLTPEFKTIADFRKDNGDAIGRVVSQFRIFCRELGLYGEQLVAIDGSFFKASNGQGQMLSQKKLDRESARIEKQVEEYLKEMERIDSLEQDEVELTAEELEEKIRQMEERQRRNREKRDSLEESGETQRCLTDSDARLPAILTMSWLRPSNRMRYGSIISITSGNGMRRPKFAQPTYCRPSSSTTVKSSRSRHSSDRVVCLAATDPASVNP